MMAVGRLPFGREDDVSGGEGPSRFRFSCGWAGEMPSVGQITELLARAGRGDEQARDALVEATYEELRGLARGYLGQHRPDHTLQATALVHEAYVRILAGQALPGESRVQFLAYVAQAMRRILIDHERARRRVKRGGNREQVPLDESLVVGEEEDLDLLALDEALTRLAGADPRSGRVVELRYFGGLTVDEVAAVVGVAPRTVKRDWDAARTWLRCELSKADGDEG